MKSVRVGLNGFGRIGRAFTRIASYRSDIIISAINTGKSSPKSLAYSLQYDSVYRRFERKVTHKERGIQIDDLEIPCYNNRNPEEIPWDQHSVDVVVDCTGVFKTREDLKKHLRGSVKKVVLTVPSSDETIQHIVLGVNDDTFDFAGSDIVSNASCTTNCAAVMVKVMDSAFGIESVMLSTIHSYTSSQPIVDETSEKFTRGRAAALSIIPTTTGASEAVCKVHPQLQKTAMAGMSIRVPTPSGSLTDLVIVTKKNVTPDEVNQAFKSASEGNLKGILGYEETELVSTDYIGSPYSCTFDANYTYVVNGNLVKIFGWYDNEWGYTSRVVDLVQRFANYL